MKKSSSVTLTLMASMALVACGPGRRCVDPAGQTAPDAMCQGPRVLPGYHWVVVSSSRTIIRSGTGIHSGSTSPSGVSRGGFGSTGGGHSSGSSGSGS